MTLEMSSATSDLVTFSLLDLSWEDVLFVSVLPLLQPCDWFRLRAVNRKHFDLVNQFFVRNRRLNLSNNKKVTVGMFRICTEQAESIRFGEGKHFISMHLNSCYQTGISTWLGPNGWLMSYCTMSSLTTPIFATWTCQSVIIAHQGYLKQLL